VVPAASWAVGAARTAAAVEAARTNSFMVVDTACSIRARRREDVGK
jgi:hypothetical protein